MLMCFDSTDAYDSVDSGMVAAVQSHLTLQAPKLLNDSGSKVYKSAKVLRALYVGG